ncbi:MAG: V-type ATP synthase subunit E [Oscillospiraceae bacterium]|nr:V-type ATP synthase subunit E [Oscillospiraceae bacterium]
MNGIEKITQRIRNDAQAEIDALLLEAEKKASTITSEAEAQATEKLRLGRRQNAEAAELHENRLISAVEMEARQLTLAAKQEVLQECFDMALKKLLALEEDAQVELLAGFAAKESESGREELLFSAETAQKIGEKVVQRANALKAGAKFTLARETRETDGVILRDGNVEINGSLAIAMEQKRQRMAAEIAEILFA